MSQIRALKKALELWNSFIDRNNMRRTMERETILRTAVSHKGHFSAADIEYSLQSSGHNFSQATVYSALSAFVEADILVKLCIDSRTALYERSVTLAGNSRTRRRHNHLVCTVCGRITETTVPEISLSSIAGKGFALPSSFEVTDVALTFFGLCAKCRRQKDRASGSSHKSHLKNKK